MEYQIQCQHQLICTGAEQVILSVLVFPKRVEEWEKEGWIIQQHENPDYYFLFNEKEQRATTPENWARILSDMGYFHQYIITPHAELQNLMISAYTDFWNENILGGKSPEPKEYNDIRMLCREPVGTIVATAEVEYLMSELKNIKSEISGTGTLAKRADMIKMSVCDYMRHEKGVEDLESKDKWILRGQDGKKLAQYSKDKNGNMIFR